ncbi:MAG: aminomethyl-transferring glycine dehydrogenase subunit GcvPB [Chitinivibrionia bacterium]|nr:aminomethyl-transferring glycine dehydrogenase subunit GcvPB [Chitinivibrionia bacterium]
MAKTIFDRSKAGRRGYRFSPVPSGRPEGIPGEYLRTRPALLPEVGEAEVVRHYTALSVLNHHVDKDFYPLGSCTMKYNPKMNEDIAANPAFSGIHPEQDDEDVQGALEVMHTLEHKLSIICGMDAFSLQGVAGAHGEMLGMMLARRYFDERGEARSKVLVPDTAHGTNPASVHLAGFTAHTIKSGADGGVDLDVLRDALDGDTAVLMLTVPNTLGLFERRIIDIIDCAHRHGALCYMDGANLNALLGRARPGDMGFDIIHINLHKTFSTPHGGGGPGAGPVGVKRALAHLLPFPRVELDAGTYRLVDGVSTGVRSIHSFYGNFAICLRALAYLERVGGEGLARISAAANLNANYLAKAVSDLFPIPYGTRCMHEFVASGQDLKQACGVRTLDVAKRLLDFGIHAPTIYFPLVVPEALMVEPTETESKETLDRFVAVMKQIVAEAKENPGLLAGAPYSCPVRRLDEVSANRQPVVAAPLQ